MMLLLGKCCWCSPSVLTCTDGSQKAPNPDYTMSVVGQTVQPKLEMCSNVFRMVWGLVLSYCYLSAKERLSSSLSCLWNSEPSALQSSSQNRWFVWLPGNSERSSLCYLKWQWTSCYLLRAAAWTFCFMRNSHHTPWTAVLTQACNGDTTSHHQ